MNPSSPVHGPCPNINFRIHGRVLRRGIRTVAPVIIAMQIKYYQNPKLFYQFRDSFMEVLIYFMYTSGEILRLSNAGVWFSTPLNPRHLRATDISLFQVACSDQIQIGSDGQ